MSGDSSRCHSRVDGVDELIAALPKVELHVHLEGSMQPALLLELAGKHRLPASLEAVRECGNKTLDAVLDAGLHSVPHAGETHGPDRIWSAIHQLGAERIGHGIRCLEDPALVEYLRSTQLPLDVCPTSNWRTGAVPQDQPHPLPALLDAGLMVPRRPCPRAHRRRPH